MNILGAKLKTLIQKIGLLIVVTLFAVLAAALMLAFFYLSLAIILFLTQKCADSLGYTLTVSDEVAKAIITLGGALCVGLLALYGVKQQNLSAEMRHKKDASLTLRKEIFLEVAEAAYHQYRILLTFADISITEENRKIMLQQFGSAFFRLQMVATQETIEAMLDSNHAWTKALLEISCLPPMPDDPDAKIIRLRDIQKRATPFMQKLWQFNIVARREIDCRLENELSYFSMMDDKFGLIDDLFKDIQMRIAAQ